MASCITSQWKTAAPQMRLTVTESTATTITSTLSWKLEYIAVSAANTSSNRPYTVYINNSAVKSGEYNIDGKKGTYTVASGTTVINKTTSNQNIPFSLSVSFNLTWDGKYAGKLTASGSVQVPMKDNYKITYNANGGTGAPGSQTKWAHTDIKLSSTKPSRTGYTFQGWATSSGGGVAYQPGANYRGNAALNLYAVWKIVTYTVSYNANGGTGAPGSQTKNYGKNLTLSSTIPTRTDYNFKGWGINESSTTVAYEAGAVYSTNAAITLYAIWELAYVAPRITDLTVDRCTSDGNSAEDGTYARVKFNWETDKTVTSIKIEYKLSTDIDYISKSVSLVGETSGSVNEIIGSSLSTESTYHIRVTVTDSGGSSDLSRDLPSMRYLIDFRPNGVSIGKPSENDDIFDVGYKSEFRELVTNKKGTFVHHAVGTKGTAGYVKIARIVIESEYANVPIKLSITQRKLSVSVDAYIKFTSIKGLDPELEYFGYIGTSSCKLYIKKVTTSVWDLYVLKLDDYDNIGITEYSTNFGYWNPSIEWTDDQIETLPDEYIQASDFLVEKISGTEPKDHNHKYICTVNTNRFTSGWIGFYGSTDDAVSATNRKGWIGNNNSDGLYVCNENGRITIGNSRRNSNENATIYGYRIDLNATTGGIYANQGIQNSSDKRLKDKIEDIPEVLISVWSEIFPKMFIWNELSGTNNNKIQFGIIAQDVVSAFEKYGLNYKDYGFVSSIVKDDSDSTENVEYFTVSYDQYHMLTALVVRKQQTKLDELDKQIQELKQLIINQGE